MNLRSIITTIIIAASAVTVSAQEITLSFDDLQINKQQIVNNIGESEFAHAGFTPTYSPGLKGYALDLTSDVPVRIPIIIEPENTPDYNKTFSVSLWVKTKPGARQGTVIMSNKKSTAPADSGWIVGTTDLGGWFFNISDGENQFDYEPTFERQAINDGAWHHLAISIDFENKEGWFFFDGQNVAVYNLSSLKGGKGALKTVVGGSDEYNDWGSRGEWTAFNGMIDEVSIKTSTLSPETIQATYREFFPDHELAIQPAATNRLKVQVWNIWHGGRRFGKHVGVSRIIDVLKKENADVIGLVETYGSGAIIADSLGYYYYLISSNLSIMSRFPIQKTIKIFHPFFSGGAMLNLGNGKQLAFFDIWLNYAPDECELFKGESVLAEFMTKEKDTRQKEIQTILKEIKSYTDNSQNIPVMVVGDFNCGSHLDWTEKEKDQHFGMVIDWKVSQAMHKAGYKDSFRQLNPDAIKDPGFTWSPLINHATPYQNCVRDRIDFIYYKGDKLTPYRSRTIEDHAPFWPSDHGSVVSWFYFQ